VTKFSAKEEKQAAAQTHSPWTGKRYGKKQTQAQLIAESMAMLRRHPTIGKCLAKA